MTARCSIAKRAALAGAVAATVAGAGFGIAGASIPDGSGVVHACYPTSGTLKPMYLIDTAMQPTCPAGFSSVDLSQSGSSSVHAYTASRTSTVAIDINGETVLTRALPAGKYVLNAKTSLTDTSSDNQYAACQLRRGADILDTEAVFIAPPGPNAGGLAYAGVALQADVNLPAGGTVSLWCVAEGANAVAPSAGGPARLAAIKVDALN